MARQAEEAERLTTRGTILLTEGKEATMCLSFHLALNIFNLDRACKLETPTRVLSSTCNQNLLAFYKKNRVNLSKKSRPQLHDELMTMINQSPCTSIFFFSC
jgi:hypothetical protein